MRKHDRYWAFMKKLPQPGGGGAHQATFIAGCLGARAGFTQEQVCNDFAANLPRGSRIVKHREIAQGVAAGFADVAGGKVRPRRPPPQVAPGLFKALVEEGLGTTEDDILARSPIPIDWDAEESHRHVIKTLYRRNELLFIGDDGHAGVFNETIRTAWEWMDEFEYCCGEVPPKIMVNPLSGEEAPKKDGNGDTLRGDACIAAHRFVVAEMDGVPIEEQLAFWRVVPNLPVAALIHSGGKSIHAWIRVDCADAEEWKNEIQDWLFPCFLEPLGVDGACKNASRLSRLPGHYRTDKGQIQRLLYLAPEGKAVSA